MNPLHIASLACALALGLVACGGSLVEQANQLTDQQANIMTEMAGIVEGIENGEDLEDARSEMAVLARKMNEIQMEWQQLSEEGLSSEEAAAVAKSHTQLNEASKRYSNAMARMLTNPAYAEHMNEVMQDFGDNAGQ